MKLLLIAAPDGTKFDSVTLPQGSVHLDLDIPGPHALSWKTLGDRYLRPATAKLFQVAGEMGIR